MKDGKKTVMGPPVLFFLPASSIKALPDSTIRALPNPAPITIYLSAPLPQVICLPGPNLIDPIIPIMPEIENLNIDNFIPIVMLPSQHPIYPTIPIMPTMLEDEIEMSPPIYPTLMEHFNYIPSLPAPKRKRIGKKVVVGDIVNDKKLSKVVHSKKKSPSHTMS
jgi:hypothetical protein